jgi:hypothetical protein
MLKRDRSFPSFYKSVKRLAELDRKERHRILKALAPQLPATPLMVQRSDAPVSPAAAPSH